MCVGGGGGGGEGGVMSRGYISPLSCTATQQHSPLLVLSSSVPECGFLQAAIAPVSRSVCMVQNTTDRQSECECARLAYMSRRWVGRRGGLGGGSIFCVMLKSIDCSVLS